MSLKNDCRFFGRVAVKKGEPLELKTLPSGMTLVEFPFVVDEGKDKEGNARSIFVRLVAWGKTAEDIVQYFESGKPMLVKCRVTPDQWEDKETGQNRSSVKFTVEEWTFSLSDKTGNSNSGNAEVETPKTAPKSSGKAAPKAPTGKRAPQPEFETSEDDDDSIPF